MEGNEMSENSMAIRQAEDVVAAASALPEWLVVEDETRKLYAPEASDAEWEVFKSEARSFGLDPRKREFMALAIGSEKVLDDRGRPVRNAEGRDTWRKTYSGYITVHGARALAARSGQLESMKTWWCGSDGQFKEIWLDEEAPYGCKVEVYLVGNSGRGFTGISTRKDFRTKTNRQTNTVELIPIWKDKPELMLEVRAEMRALRRAGLLADHPGLDRGFITYDEDGEPILVQKDNAQRIKQSRKLHAIAAGRGVDHDGARNAVHSIDNEVESLAEADAEVMAGAGDMIEVLDADGVETITGVPAEDVQGEPYDAVPEPDPVSEGMSLEQRTWIVKYRDLATEGSMPRKFTGQEMDWMIGIEEPTYEQADELIVKMNRLLPIQDAAPVPATPADTEPSRAEEVDGWTEHWKAVKAAGLTRANILQLTKSKKYPEGLEGAAMILRDAIKAKAKAEGSV
jgi:hypothetical protein